MDTSKVTRFEVISMTGHRMVELEVSVELSLQDEGRTLKVFMEKRDNEGTADHPDVTGPES